jgi:hypothetical protein
VIVDGPAEPEVSVTLSPSIGAAPVLQLAPEDQIPELPVQVSSPNAIDGTHANKKAATARMRARPEPDLR